MATISKTPAAASPRPNRRPDRRFIPSSAYSAADADASAWSPAPAPVPDPLADAPPPPHPPAVDFAHGLGDPNAEEPATPGTSAPTVAQFFGAGAGAPQPPAKLITADYRAMTHSQLNEARGAKSSWDQTFRRCTNPIQLRVTVSRLLAQPAPPVPEDVISALNACARLALLGGKGVAPLMDAVATNQNDVPSSTTTSEGESVRRTRADQFQRESFEVAQSIMKALTSRRTIPSLHIYSAYIRVCAHAGQVDAAFQALEDLKRNGIVPDTEIYKGLVMASARQGDLQRALAAVETSVQNASSITRHAKWLSMALRMAVGIEAGKWLGILVSVTTGMHEIATQIIGIGFGTVFGLRLAIPVLMPNATNRDGSIPGLSPPDTQRGHFADAPYQPVEANSVFQSHDANEVNEHMHNFLIATLEKSGNVDGALKILDQMKAKGIPVTVTTYNNLIADLVHLNRPAVALQTIDKMTAIKPTIFTFLPVTQYYYDRRQFDQVIHVYETMMKPRKIPLDLVTYTSIISSYGKANKVDEAMQLFDAFLRDGFHPNYFVLNTLISILANGGRMREAEHILLNLMPKYNVHPTLRSYAKLIEKARFIDPKTYTPPPSPDFQPPPFPMHLVQTTNSSDAGTGSPVIPIQVQRAWYWYHFLRCTGLQMTIVPTNLFMFVLNSFHLPRVSLHVYRDAIQSTAAVPLLVTASCQPAVDPELNTYLQLISALATDPTVSLEGVLAFVYELKARNAWPYALPSPRNVPALAVFTDRLVGVRVAPIPPTVPVAVLRRRHAIILNYLLARAMAPPKGAVPADRESKAVLLAICDAFSAVNARFSWARAESEVVAAAAPASTPLLDILDGGGRNVASAGAVGGEEPPVAALLDEDEDDADVVLSGAAATAAASTTPATDLVDLTAQVPARDVAREPEIKQQQVGLGFHYILLQRELLEGRKPRTVPGRARHHFDHRHEQHQHQHEPTAPAPARSCRAEAKLARAAAVAEPVPRAAVRESRAAVTEESAPKDDVMSALRGNRGSPSPSTAPVEEKTAATTTVATSAEPNAPAVAMAKETTGAAEKSQQSSFWTALQPAAESGKDVAESSKEAVAAPAAGEKKDFTVQRGFWDKF
ncbi:pentatricopeptide repeat domain-containing protein [Allomyces macrogynus ATCC 38327]|uniref:Pentatricopeptide repeat domain-containing protein n=1 Tax=Allomyces macrogynus (strain ATCC 38327) TaxID=578462 RepID=A0A0L0SVV9_ALLM3|nr:pentatricopeptide repeat domain-containing protein [Allomyces macrogynus ATCC 38327]|eukprot:KNE66611.1 pentatricopeptide repeat domain-containing protein [Allomyces macrogynus ATCC 38327]